MARPQNRGIRPTARKHSFLTGEEKGTDVRIAPNVIRLPVRRIRRGSLSARTRDLSEVAEEIRMIAREQQGWTKIASALPHSSAARDRRGINKTE